MAEKQSYQNGLYSHPDFNVHGLHISETINSVCNISSRNGFYENNNTIASNTSTEEHYCCVDMQEGYDSLLRQHISDAHGS